MQLSGSRNAADVGKPRRRGSLSIADGNQHHHAVQFYETDAFLVRSVTNFIIDGLKAEEPALIIATAEHRDGIEAALMSHGVDVEWSKRRGLLTEFDARYTLSSIMSGGVPDEALFRRQIEPALENVRRRRRSSSVRAYGEMVNLLWCDGNGGAALALEALWNQLAETQQFSLLCGYCMSLFDDAADSKILSALCGEHTHVVPTERYLERDDMSRLVEITSLQQRAQALESEIKRREVLESTLRSALQERERLLDAERRARAEAEAARQVAEQANRAKGDFLAVMSHELRTPLNAIGGYAELMELGLEGELSKGQHTALERIQRSQRHLLGLINQVLNYTRLEAGTVQFDLGDHALDPMLRAADALVFPQMQAKGVRYTYDGCDPGIVVRVDSEKLQQILLNLLTNATKFTDTEGAISVNGDVVGDLARVRVRDTGVGIPVDKLAAIFDPFVQVDSHFTRTREGIGLGLAISRDLARKMGGELSVESTIGVGSTFTLSLPRAR
jgi:signal transduction histidine kinase